MNRKISNTVIYVVIFSIGCCIGKLFNYGYFVLDNEISIIDAISLFATIGCAIYITKVLEKGVQEDRIEKNIFIEQLESIEKYLCKIDDKLDTDCILYRDMVSMHSQANKQRHKFFTRVKKHKGSWSKNSIVIKCEETLDLNFKLLKPLLTDTPVNKKTTRHITSKGGKMTYSEERLVEIRETLQAINDDLFTLKMLINKI